MTDPKLSPTKAESDSLIERAKEDKDYFSSTLSSLTRTTNLGLLATIWAALTSDIFDAEILSSYLCMGIQVRDVLLFFMAFIALALLIDYAQYYFGYKKGKKVIQEIEAGEHPGGRLWDATDIRLRLQEGCYTWKVRITLFNVLSVTITLFALLVLY